MLNNANEKDILKWKQESGMFEGAACVLIKEPELNDKQHPFWAWLEDEGFYPWNHHVQYKGEYWVYININTRYYLHAMSDIPLPTPIGNHAVTIQEFKTIWEIYKKYSGLPLLKMNNDDIANETLAEGNNTDVAKTKSLNRLERLKAEVDVLLALQNGYEEGNFESISPFLNNNSVFESQWVWLPLTGKKDIMDYLRGKGNTLRETNAFPHTCLVDMNGEYGLKLEQDGSPAVIVTTQLDDNYQVLRIDLADADCYQYSDLDAWVEIIPECLVLDSSGAKKRCALKKHIVLFPGGDSSIANVYFEFVKGMDYGSDMIFSIQEWLDMLKLWDMMYQCNSFDAFLELYAKKTCHKTNDSYFKDIIMNLWKLKCEENKALLSDLHQWTDLLRTKYKSLYRIEII